MSPKTEKPINFRPMPLDVEAIEKLKVLHPNLTTTADVLRYALHMTLASEEASTFEEDVRLPSPEEAEVLRKKIASKNTGA